MPQQTAMLGWGSLLWEGGSAFDGWYDEWRQDGPCLKLEFSRVSSSRLGALTLVIDSKYGSPCTVSWCLSKRTEPEDAVADLRCREGCQWKHIARLDLAGADPLPSHPGVEGIAVWAKERKIDVVVWTALPGNFEAKVKQPFSVTEALAYLMRLPRPAKAKAAEYIWRAPEAVHTPLRTAAETEPWFPGQGAGS